MTLLFYHGHKWLPPKSTEHRGRQITPPQNDVTTLVFFWISSVITASSCHHRPLSGLLKVIQSGIGLPIVTGHLNRNSDRLHTHFNPNLEVLVAAAFQPLGWCCYSTCVRPWNGHTFVDVCRAQLRTSCEEGSGHHVGSAEIPLVLYDYLFHSSRGSQAFNCSFRFDERHYSAFSHPSAALGNSGAWIWFQHTVLAKW